MHVFRALPDSRIGRPKVEAGCRHTTCDLSLPDFKSVVTNGILPCITTHFRCHQARKMGPLGLVIPFNAQFSRMPPSLLSVPTHFSSHREPSPGLALQVHPASRPLCPRALSYAFRRHVARPIPDGQDGDHVFQADKWRLSTALSLSAFAFQHSLLVTYSTAISWQKNPILELLIESAFRRVFE